MDKLQENILKKDFEAILGQEETKKQLKSALFMNRHVILLGPPGVGKTTLAKNVYEFLETKNKELFVRVQGSPDLTAEDLLGDIDPIKAIQYGPLSKEAFTKGKIFKANGGILFFDEINRCSEKLQNALLQVLEERKITIGSYDVDFDCNFIFIGTMNPEDTSTEPLSDVFLDRFDIISIGYPETLDIEKEIVTSKGKKIVEFPVNLLDYAVSFIRELRNDERLEKKPSVRASIGIYERAQSNALLEKRKTVILEDIKAVISSVLAHRIKLKPSVKYLETTDSFIEEEFTKFKKGDYL
ncbi:MoxR family ATPase [Candidatus Woesearchaeota archaeon]|nr:MAG: MoxR family ATPase [Candidatus Woesearchaeota archaeon]